MILLNNKFIEIIGIPGSGKSHIFNNYSFNLEKKIFYVSNSVSQKYK